MPPRGAAGKEKANVEEEEQVLQAVIIADSFNKRFKPLTVNRPRCLLPICNATLLDWTFESLALAGVQEIFVVCRSHAEKIKATIRESKWSKASSGLKITPIVTAKEAFSVGDAMRDIYTHGIITTDFVLVMGDLVSNIRIDEVVRIHKERRKANKDAIMTMIVKEAGTSHRTRPRGETSVFVIDPSSSECLHYESVPGFPAKELARIPREILKDHPELEIRNDLIDCQIDICSPEVPSLFQDNFDYLDIRRDFVHGVLTSDLLGKSIHCHIVQEGYAARVKDTKSYAAISQDILSRWTFPLVPDDNHPGGRDYEHLRGNKYFSRDNTVSLSRSCVIGPNTLIGAHSSIFHEAQVSSSVLGERCIIGQGAVIRDSVLWDGVIIDAGVIIERCILGERVHVKENTTIEKGCLIADGVVLGPNAHITPFTRVSARPHKRQRTETSDEEDISEDSDLEDILNAQDSHAASQLGKDSNGIIWPDGPTEDDEDLNEIDTYNNQRLLRLGDDASDLELDDAGSVTSSESESSDDDGSLHGFGASRASSVSSLPSHVQSLSLSLSNAAESEFKSEVMQSLERAFTEGHSVEDAAVELKTLRMASNVPLTKVREAVIGAIVDRIKLVPDHAGQQRKEIASVVERWGDLISQIGGADAVETITLLQLHCASSPTRLALFAQVLASFYQEDVVEEEDIRAWHKISASKVSAASADIAERMKRCWTIGSRMIEQFDEQEEGSDSE